MKANKWRTLYEKHQNYFIFVLMSIYMIALTLFVFFFHDNLITTTDTESYTTPARGLLDLKGFAEYGFPVGFRTPGYPLFLALVFLLKGNLYVVVGIQTVISVLCMYAVYRTCLLMNLKIKTALICSAFYACELGIYIYSSLVLTDAFFMHMVVFAVYFLTKYVVNKRTFDFVAFVVLLNYALMVRPILIYFNTLVCVMLIVFFIMKKLSLKKVFLAVSILIFVLGGWSLRNYYKTGVFQYSVVQNYNSFRYDGAILRGQVEGITLKEAREAFEKDFDREYPAEKLEGMKEAEIYTLKGRMARDYKKENFGAYIIMNVKGLFKVLFGPNKSFIANILPSRMGTLIIIGLYEVFLFIIYGMYLLGWITNFKKAKLTDWFILMYSGYCAVASSNVGYARFRVAFIGLIILGAFTIWNENPFLENTKKSMKRLWERKRHI